MSYNTGTLGLPIVLLASLWGAVNTTLNFYRFINERRDEVFRLLDECGRCPGRSLGPFEIYFTNMMPLTVGVCLFLVLITYVIATIPEYMDIDDDGERRRFRGACYAIACLPAFGLIGFFGGGTFDALVLFSRF